MIFFSRCGSPPLGCRARAARRRLVRAVLLLAGAGMLGALSTSPASARVTMEGAYAQPATTVGVIYGTIVNHGAVSDRFISAASPAAKAVELHRSLRVPAMGGEMSGMQMLPAPTAVFPPHGTLRLLPGAAHLMLLGLRRPLRPGDHLLVRLRFAHAGILEVIVPVRAF